MVGLLVVLAVLVIHLSMHHAIDYPKLFGAHALASFKIQHMSKTYAIGSFDVLGSWTHG